MENKKLNKKPYEKLIAIVKNIVPQLKASLLSLLEQHGKPIEFDWENGYAPSIVSGQFDDDITDCYITKIWADKGLVMVNIHAYYLGDDREDIDLSRECLGASDYAEIMEYVLGEIED